MTQHMSTESAHHRLQHAYVWLAASMYAAYIVALWLLDMWPYQDIPNHIARAFIVSDLLFDQGAVFGSDFEFSFSLVPTAIVDLALAATMRLLPADIVGSLAIFAMLISMPAGLVVFARSRHLSNAAVATIALLSLYLTTDMHLTLGFLSYKIGIGIAFAALAILPAPDRPALTGRRYAAFFLMCLLAYSVHLAAAAMLAVGTGMIWLLAWKRERTLWMSAPVLVAPFLVMAVLVLSSGTAGGGMSWGSVLQKADVFVSMFYRFAIVPDALVLMLFAAAVGVILLHGTLTLRDGALRESLALAAAYLFVFLALPADGINAAGLDNRALPFFWCFVLLAAVRAWELNGLRRFAILGGAAALVAAANLTLICLILVPFNRQIEDYRQTLAAVPLQSHVLPVAPRSERGRSKLHLGAYAVLDRQAVIPYLFSGDRGYPQRFFNYRRTPEVPSEHWYEADWAAPRWDSVAREWPYVIVAGPADKLAGTAGLTTVASSEVSALFHITLPSSVAPVQSGAL